MVKGIILLPLAVILLLSGCASTPSDYRDPRDPFESFNRAMTRFNDDFDRDIFKPMAQTYKRVTPTPVNRGITNFFGNLADVTSAANNLLQFKLIRAGSDVGRVVVNTTLGLLGFMDVASNLNLEIYREDFGQTLGYWGLPNGPYLVLPFLGSSTIRDTGGMVVDWIYLDPLAYIDLNEWRYVLTFVELVDKRADLLGAKDVLAEAALDPYEFARDAYLQKRLNEVHDGNPPDEYFEFEDEFLEEEEDLEDELPEESGQPAPPEIASGLLHCGGSGCGSPAHSIFQPIVSPARNGITRSEPRG